MTKPPKIIITEAQDCSVISLDLAEAKVALDLAERIAKRTGKKVVVCDEDGSPLGTFGGSKSN